MNLERLIDLQSKLVADGKLHPVTDFEPRRFAFLINLDPSGAASRPVSPLRTGPKTPDENGRIYQAPVTDRTSGTNANLLYDTREYVLGAPVSSEVKKIARAKDRLADFKRKIGIIRSLTHRNGRAVPELEAAWNFYHANEGAYFEEFLRSDSFKEIMDAPYTLWISFRLEGTSYPVFNTPDLEPYLVPSNLISADRSGQCLVTGQTGLLGDIHTPIRGVVGAQETGAALVSFNQKAFNSYGLEATENAPILRSVTRGYGRGLNYLLKDQRHHIRIGNGKYPGDGSILIWDDTHTTTGIPEVLVGDMLEASDREHVIGNFRSLRDRVVVDGTVPRATAGTVYALELKANSARIAVTNWSEDSAEIVYGNVIRWFDDMEITVPSAPKNWPKPMTRYIAVMEFLEAMSGLTEQEISRLKASLIRSAISGTRTEANILPALLRAFKASIIEHRGSFLLSLYQYRLAALAKLILTRSQGGQPVSIDPGNRRQAYNLGRLFALMERTQEMAIPKLNNSILSRLSGAMEMPSAEFPSLVKLNTKHLRELGAGTRMWLERQIGEVYVNLGYTSSPSPFPRTLTAEEQGEFAMGYWQQKTSLFQKRETQETTHDAA